MGFRVWGFRDFRVLGLGRFRAFLGLFGLGSPCRTVGGMGKLDPRAQEPGV